MTRLLVSGGDVTPGPIELIIDCDPGIDDALALFLAAAAPERLNLLGVTAVAGNRPVAVTTANARAVMRASGCGGVPVFEGAAGPIGGQPPRCNLVHGEDGLGGVRLPSVQAVPVCDASQRSPSAAEFIAGTLSQRPAGSVTLVAVGPLTNLALAERQVPGVLRRCRELLVMGGAVGCPGNVTPLAEFNFHADALAAREVLASGARVTLFGLDVTSQAALPGTWIAGLSTLGNRCGAWAQSMLQAYAAQDPLLHDVCPLAHLLAPSLFAGRAMPLQVDIDPGPGEGRVHAAWSAGPAAPLAQVMEGVDTPALLALLRERLSRLP